MKFRISELRVLPAVDLIDPTAGAKWAIGARGDVSRCMKPVLASCVSQLLREGRMLKLLIF